MNSIFLIGLATIVGFIALVVGLVIFAGLFRARSLMRRELNAYFQSPIAYVILVVFLFAMGWLFNQSLELLTAKGPRGVEFPMTLMLGDWVFWLVFAVIPPVLSMRLFAEERGTGTLEVLMTSPLRDWEVVLTKYLACYIFYLLLWIPTLAFLPVLLDMGTPVIKPVGTFSSVLFTGGIGVILLSLVSFMFPLGRGGRLFGVFVLLAGVAGAVWGGWEHFRFFDKSHLVLISVEFDAIWVVLFLGGIGAIILSLLSFLLPLGTGGRLFGAFLLVVGIGCATGGGWSHFRFDDEHLISIPVGIDPMPVLSSYIGIALVGAMFLSLGLLVSSMVRSQLVAFLLSFALGLIFIVVGIWRPDLETNTPWHQFLYSFTVPLHFSRDFGRGLIDTRHLVVYGTVSLFCLFMTVRSLESRRWQ